MSQLLPYAFAKSKKVLCEKRDGLIVLTRCSASDQSAVGEVIRKHGPREVVLALESDMEELIQKSYAESGGTAASVVSQVEGDADLGRLMQDLPQVADLLESMDDAPIIRMLNALLTQAAKDGASDIHIEPYERHSSVRFRVDGRLREVVQPNRALHAALISRLKIMAELDISEKRLRQH